MSEGVVAVGPAGYRGETSGTLLVSPARAVFGTADARLIASLPSDGSHAAVALSGDTRTAPTLAPVAAPDLAGDVDAHGTSQGVQGVQGLHAAPAGLARHGHEPAADADSHERGALHAPTSEAARASAKTASRAAGISAGMSVSAARAAMIACLRSATANTPGAQLSVTVATHITVTLDGDARVTTVQFVPPLRPKIQGKCAAVLWGATVVGAGESFVIPFATR
ncbi:MAG: hypothetical protein EXR75_14080 [Myxococcales bacterium]|nr:hypothetical protein [Myxococcales bacterium]